MSNLLDGMEQRVVSTTLQWHCGHVTRHDAPEVVPDRCPECFGWLVRRRLAGPSPDASALRLAYDLTVSGDVASAGVLLADLGGAEDRFGYLTVLAGWHKKQRQFPEALLVLDEALGLRPLDATVHFNRGMVLYELGEFAAAVLAQRAALRIAPGFAKAWMKLGACHMVLQEFPEALACCERAVAGDPADAELACSMGTIVSAYGDDAAAEALYRRALVLDPAMAEAECGLGFVLLRQGKWVEGWRCFEARHRLQQFGGAWDRPVYRLPVARADELRGKVVVLVSEQGNGDTIQFARYVPLVAALARRTVLVTSESLARLMGGLGVDVLVRGMDLALDDLDAVVLPLMSLPLVFGTTVEDVPAPALYRVAARGVGVRVGLCCQGGARPEDAMAHADDLRRSIAWKVFKPLADVVPCVSLQEDDLGRFGVTDWAGTAEIVAGLDLVVTVDTAVAHLAASLGVETWMLARAGGCWRWLGSGERTVWYPAMRIYRQPVLCEWAPVVERVVADLRRWADA